MAKKLGTISLLHHEEEMREIRKRLSAKDAEIQEAFEKRVADAVVRDLVNLVVTITGNLEGDIRQCFGLGYQPDDLPSRIAVVRAEIQRLKAIISEVSGHQVT